jgi:prepilin-type N-terminal cleavage/methylation domain-containing protein
VSAWTGPSGPTSRRGFTLVELMLVILIMLTVTVITVAMVSPAMRGRRLREAARQVNVFLNAARNRAIQTGQPWGVIIERQPGFPSASVLLHLCRTPPIYAGDSQNAALRLHTLGVDPQTGLATVGATVKVGQISPGLLRPGDEMLLNYHAQQYVVALVNDGDGDGYFDDLNLADSNGDGWYDVPPQASAFPILLHVQLRPGSSPTALPWPVADPSQLANPSLSGPVAFQAKRQPQRSSAATLALPEGTCIDLGGMDALNNVVPTSGLDEGDLGTFRPRPANPGGSPPIPEDTSPIVILFSPEGGVERVYRWDPPAFSLWSGRPVFGPVYLLIGYRDKVNGDATRPPGERTNLEDLNALWVAISPRTGMVVTAENSRLVQNPYDVWSARRRAREQAGMGGR